MVVGRPAGHGAADGAGGGRGDDRGEDLHAPPERLEAQDLPALLGGELGELRVGVHGDGMADGAQHRHVGGGVGVGVGGGEVEAVALGELSHAQRLALAVAEGTVEAAGVRPVALLQAAARGAVEAEHVGEHVGRPLRGRGADVDGPARVLVVVGRLQHRRVQPRQHAGQHAGREALRSRTRRPRSHSPRRSLSSSVSASVAPRRRNWRFAHASAAIWRRVRSPAR